MTPSPSPSIEAEWQESVRRRELRRYASHVHELAERVKLTEDFTTHTPLKLASLIAETARLLAELIPTAPADSLHEINDLLGRIAAHLRYVERARVAQTPWSLISSAEDFLTKQAGAKTLFIIRPTWSYNYSIIGEFWSFYRVVLTCWSWFPLADLQQTLQLKDDDAIYCVSFPRIERQNCLLHANWGHEVGHIIASRWAHTHFASLWGKAQPDVQKRIEAQVRKSPPPFDPLFKEIAINQAVSYLTSRTMEAARRGLEELLCDRIGTHLLGPSAVSAAIEFAARFDMDVSPLQCDYYPPWRYRLRLMLQYCEADLASSGSYPGEILGPFVDWLLKTKTIADSRADGRVLESDMVTKEAYGFIEKYWESIAKETLSLLPKESQTPYGLCARHLTIEKLVKRLQAGIPPNEVCTLGDGPASFEDIISAGWAFKILNISSNPAWGNPEDFDLLFRLILKACDSSHVHAVWGSQLRGET